MATYKEAQEDAERWAKYHAKNVKEGREINFVSALVWGAAWVFVVCIIVAICLVVFYP